MRQTSGKEKSSYRIHSKKGACFTEKPPHSIYNQMRQMLSYFEATLVPFHLITDTVVDPEFAFILKICHHLK